eukprot:NODE_2714_length_1113_cov_14.016227_g2590_i0.p1 GENE.NODE_2714_length_1113_cov_14.016227_g2590_i0~~NODE_2714_length_1113_cov_14.016227_g2590_i0.p1  ORF type:complete len:311 (-),score=70.00 NODE_2714_length_1113_cov_14.016227_g2590_i0:127-1059(-)
MLRHDRRHAAPEDVEDEYSRILRRHQEKQQRQKVFARALKADHKQQLLAPDKRGQIDLKAHNSTQYNKTGFNVKLYPLPDGWQHEDLRRLLARVNAPCPLAWNLQPEKRIAWIDYDFPKHQREAIECLHQLTLPDGNTMTAVAVESERKRKPVFYRECDDGRVGLDPAPAAATPKPAKSRKQQVPVTYVAPAPPEASTAPASTSESPAAPDAPVLPTIKRRGRGFSEGKVCEPHMRADEAEVPAVAPAPPTTPSVCAAAVSETTPTEGVKEGKEERPNTALLAKYKFILKKINERKRTLATELEPDPLSD